MDDSVCLLHRYSALDLTDLKGQLCGRLLADLGMEVIKVEPPGGDPARRLGPCKEGTDGGLLSLRFAHLNAGKKSIVLDLQANEDRSTFHRLVERADVVLESFPPTFLESVGLNYRDIVKINPGVVMASISGFGQSGPYRDFSVTDSVVFAMGGLMSISGDPDLPPCKAPETQAYYFGSLMAALGVVSALYERERTGTGDWIDVSMQEAMATQEHLIRSYANEKKIMGRNGSQHAQVAPAKIFPCRDGYVYLYISRFHWKKFLEVWSDHPAELDDAHWLPNPFRRERAEYLTELVAGFTSRYTKEKLTVFLQSHGIPCTPVNRPRDFLNDAQVRFRQLSAGISYPDVGTIYQLAAPFMINGRRPSLRPAPSAGQHQDAILRENVGESSREAPVPGRPSGASHQPPLAGLRVLSFDHVLAGPYGMTLLAELGADIIKVESRRGGLDPFRYFGTSDDPNLSPRFLEFNRNKRSVTINLKHPDGPGIIKELVQKCDVVMDNFSARVMPSMGLSYEDLVKNKPDITALRMPGLGCTGPKREYATLGTNITAFTGFTYLWNHPGRTGPPIGSQIVFPDYVSGTWAALLVVSAELYRNQTGRGLSIDFSQGEAAGFLLGVSLMESLNTESEPEPMGNDWPFAAPHGCYACKGQDRWCVIAVETDEQWRALVAAMDRPELANDQRYGTFEARRRRHAELRGPVGAWTRERDCHEVMKSLQRVGVPCGAVQNGADLVRDEHLQARGFIVAQDNERVGHTVLPGLPIRFANSSARSRWTFPELGRDTEAVLRELLGYDSERIGKLVRDGVLD